MPWKFGLSKLESGNETRIVWKHLLRAFVSFMNLIAAAMLLYVVIMYTMKVHLKPSQFHLHPGEYSPSDYTSDQEYNDYLAGLFTEYDKWIKGSVKYIPSRPPPQCVMSLCETTTSPTERGLLEWNHATASDLYKFSIAKCPHGAFWDRQHSAYAYRQCLKPTNPSGPIHWTVSFNHSLCGYRDLAKQLISEFNTSLNQLNSSPSNMSDSLNFPETYFQIRSISARVCRNMFELLERMLELDKKQLDIFSSSRRFNSFMRLLSLFMQKCRKVFNQNTNDWDGFLRMLKTLMSSSVSVDKTFTDSFFDWRRYEVLPSTAPLFHFQTDEFNVSFSRSECCSDEISSVNSPILTVLMFNSFNRTPDFLPISFTDTLNTRYLLKSTQYSPLHFISGPNIISVKSPGSGHFHLKSFTFKNLNQNLTKRCLTLSLNSSSDWRESSSEHVFQDYECSLNGNSLIVGVLEALPNETDVSSIVWRKVNRTDYPGFDVKPDKTIIGEPRNFYPTSNKTEWVATLGMMTYMFSFLCLLITLATYGLFPKLRQGRLSTKFLMSLCTSLCLNFVFIIITSPFTDTAAGCQFSLVINAYLILVTLIWNGLSCLGLSYTAFPSYPMVYGDRFVRRGVVVALGLPAVIVGIPVALRPNLFQGEYVVCDWICRLPVLTRKWFFLFPIGCIVVCNLLALLWSLKTVIRPSELFKDGGHRHTAWVQMRCALGELVLLTSGFVVSAYAVVHYTPSGPVLFEDQLILQIVYFVCTGAQGFFILVFYCGTHADARHQWVQVWQSFSAARQPSFYRLSPPMKKQSIAAVLTQSRPSIDGFKLNSVNESCNV